MLSTGAVAVFKSFELHAVGPFWLGGAVTIFGVLLGVLGWKLIARSRGDAAVEASRHHDEQVAHHREHLPGGDPPAPQQSSLEHESSLEDPPEPR